MSQTQKIINKHSKDLAFLKSLFIWTVGNYGSDYAKNLNWHGLDTDKIMEDAL